MEQFSQTLAIGSQLQHYQIQSVLGEGGFGVTYKAYNTRIKQTVAIKEYLPSDLAFRESSTTQVYARSGGKQEEFAYGLKKFLEEAQTLAQFNHPNIVRAYDFFEENGTGYLVMEYADGQSLDELIKAGGALSEDRVISYFLPLLDGLAEVHSAGLLHRDIKPANIYIRSNGNSLLIDFGAARQAVGQHSKSVTGIVSQGYAPTEQYGTNAKRQGPWTDLYAIGATLYKCVTGETPIDAPTRRDDIHDEGLDPLSPASKVGKGRYSEALLAAIDQCLKVGIKQRPQTIDELKRYLSATDSEAPNKASTSAKTRMVNEEEAGFQSSTTKEKVSAEKTERKPEPEPSRQKEKTSKTDSKRGTHPGKDGAEKPKVLQAKPSPIKESLKGVASFFDTLIDKSKNLSKKPGESKDGSTAPKSDSRAEHSSEAKDKKINQSRYEMLKSSRKSDRVNTAFMVLGCLIVIGVYWVTSESDRDWSRTKKLNTEQAYIEYMDKWPSSIHIESANVRIQRLEVADWKRADRLKSIASYREFLQKWPNGRLKTRAEVAITKLTPRQLQR